MAKKENLKQEKIMNVNKGGRPRKYNIGTKRSDRFTTISVTKDNKMALQRIRAKEEKTFDDTVSNLIQVMEKIGRDYLNMSQITPQAVLDEIANHEREKRKEEGKI